MNGLLPSLNMGSELTDIGGIAGNIIKDLLPWVGIAFGIFAGIILIGVVVELVGNIRIGKKESSKAVIIYDVKRALKVK